MSEETSTSTDSTSDATQAASGGSDATQAKRTYAPRLVSFDRLESGDLQIEFVGEGIEPITLNPANLPPTVLTLAAADGIIDRLRRFGESADTADDKRAAILAGIEKLNAGQWTMPRGRPSGTGEAAFTLVERAAHLYKIEKAKALGQTYEKTLAETAEELSPIVKEDDAVRESVKNLDDKAKAEAIAKTKLSRLKATAVFKAAWTKVKAEEAARQAEKAAKKAQAGATQGEAQKEAEEVEF